MFGWRGRLCPPWLVILALLVGGVGDVWADPGDVDTTFHTGIGPNGAVVAVKVTPVTLVVAIVTELAAVGVVAVVSRLVAALKAAA